MLLAIVLAGILLYAAFRGVDLAEIWAILHRVRPSYVTVVLLLCTVAYLLRAVRWRVLLRSEGQTPTLRSVFAATMVGYMANGYLPARAGEVIRSAMLGSSTGRGTSFVLATALSERLLDAIALVLIGAGTVPFVVGLPSELRAALFAMGIIGLLGLVCLLVAPRIEGSLSKWVSRLPLPARLHGPLGTMLTRFLMGMRACQRPRTAAAFAALTAIIWLNDAFTWTVLARAFQLSLSLPQAFVLLAALGLSSAIPSTPGFIGVYQFVAVAVLPLFGYSREHALAYILMVQAIAYFMFTALGLPSFWLFYRSRERTGQRSDNGS
jgi:glycosyltransferase 2 family protein